MKIAIVGAGFTGLTAAFRLSKQGHTVHIFEKEKKVGGLAGTYIEKDWKYAVEKHYHHWFQNDYSAINLIKELGLTKDLFFASTQTSTFYKDHTYPFNSAKDILAFTPLPLVDRLRLGAVSAYLKLLPSFLAISLEKWTAVAWIKKYYGEKSYRIVWEPLLKGKFGPFVEIVNAAWFWARIKKRTFKLGYIKGGYQNLLSTLEKKVKEEGVSIKLGISTNRKVLDTYDKVIMTTPTPVFLSLYPELNKIYKNQIESVPRLHALNLLLISKEKILPQTYWLNVNDRSYPFIAVVQQTNLTNPSWYGGKNLTYIGNYLPENHPYLSMSAEELFKKFLPYLKKINPSLHLHPSTYSLQLFKGLYAQPVFPIKYSEIRPAFTTPLHHVLLANMDMVYPWDRGTNYAIKMGEEVAIYVSSCIK